MRVGVLGSLVRRLGDCKSRGTAQDFLMQNVNDADGAIREGEPPFIPSSCRASQGDSPGQPATTWVLKCLWPVALGCLFSGCTATSQIPNSISVADRVLVFVAIMAGPFCAPILLGT